MAGLLWILVCVYGLVVAAWWFRHILISLPNRLDMVIHPVLSTKSPRILSVVIPARNERAGIGDCVISLLNQGPIVGEIIIVDDRSEDGTADVGRRAAAGDSRVRVVRVDALPPGWAGKAYACQIGGQAAHGAWILFSDADCRFLPGGLAGAVSYAERQNVDLLSLWPRADNRSFWEHMLIPLCGALILLWFPPLLANRRAGSVSYANGQFLLFRRGAYLRIGGHGIARDAVIEDIPLGHHAKKSGLVTRTGLGPDIVSVRMYNRYSEIRDGWTRIFIGALRRPWKLLATVWSLVGGSLLPSAGALAIGYRLASHDWPGPTWAQAGVVLVLLHFIAVYSVSYRLWGLCRCRRVHLLLYPLSCLVVIGILLRAWWWMITRRPIFWRGSLTGPHVSDSVGSG